jgi:hypothetical protein
MELIESQATDKIKFACSSCGTNLVVEKYFAGTAGPCPICATVQTAPLAESFSAPYRAAGQNSDDVSRRDSYPAAAAGAGPSDSSRHCYQDEEEESSGRGTLGPPRRRVLVVI